MSASNCQILQSGWFIAATSSSNNKRKPRPGKDLKGRLSSFFRFFCAQLPTALQATIPNASSAYLQKKKEITNDHQITKHAE